MRCPKLNDLPAPQTGKIGWPWREENLQLSDKMPDGTLWPRISIITPSYNQGQFIEETIRSVLLQGYPNLEYIVIDGGSTDKSIELIRKYEKYLEYWVSEPDRGQSHAINKGFARATGEIVAWVNSDDMLVPGSLSSSAPWFIRDQELALLYGNSNLISEAHQLLSTPQMESFSLHKLLYEQERHLVFHVPFIRKTVLERVGVLDERLHFAMDYEFCCRIASSGLPVRCINQTMSNFRFHAGSKTGNIISRKEYFLEGDRICRSYGGQWWNYMYRMYWRILLWNRVKHSRFAFLLSVYRYLKKFIFGAQVNA